MRRTVLASLLALMSFAGSAYAAEENGSATQAPAAPVAVSSLSSVTGLTQHFDVRAAAVANPRASLAQRPSMLTSLYVGSALLQGFDAYSTIKVLNGGGSEANPLMRGVTQSPTAFIAIKAGITAASILAAEKMWKDHNRVGAVVTMVASNVLMGVVAANNSRVMSQIR